MTACAAKPRARVSDAAQPGRAVAARGGADGGLPRRRGAVRGRVRGGRDGHGHPGQADSLVSSIQGGGKRHGLPNPRRGTAEERQRQRHRRRDVPNQAEHTVFCRLDDAVHLHNRLLEGTTR